MPGAPAVLHATDAVDGGVGRVVLELVADQAARGWHVATLSPVHAPFAEAVARAGATPLVWPAPLRLASERSAGVSGARPRGLRAFARACDSWPPDVVHLHASQAGLTGRLAVRGRVPTVFQPHAWSFLALTGATERLARAWERAAAHWTAAVVCVSEAERRLGEQAGIRARWHVVPNGVDTEAIRPTDRGGARTELGLDAGPLVVCVGALRRQKGQDALLSAWPAVIARVPDARLALVGDGPDRDALEAAAPDGVLFTGWRDDVPAWLAAADLVAAPSRWEGMALTLLEAMAAGRAVVATDVAGAAEALGETGEVVPPGQPEALADALAERLLDPARAEREGLAARARAEAHHDVRAACAAVAGLYGELLD